MPSTSKVADSSKGRHMPTSHIWIATFKVPVANLSESLTKLATTAPAKGIIDPEAKRLGLMRQ
uniref:Uncharacterized protein n=1 Tax=Populus trichocarpa TaxID=3694 RepID=A0A2K2AUW8_POPTR